MTRWKQEQFRLIQLRLVDPIIFLSRLIFIRVPYLRIAIQVFNLNPYKLLSYWLNLLSILWWQGLKDSGIGSQGITNSINMMTKIKSTVINLPTPSYTVGWYLIGALSYAHLIEYMLSIYLEYITGKIKSLYVIFLAFTGK